VTPIDELVPTVRYKRAIERELLASGLDYTIWRSAPFAEVWFALCGCATVTRGAPSTPARSLWFTRVFLKVASGLVERRGIALVPGDGNARQAFVSIADVAALLARSIGHPAARNAILDLGGPDVMTWNDAAQLMGRVLGRPVKAMHTPTAVYRAQMALLRPVSEHAANIMGLNWFATYPTTFEMGATYATFGIRPTRLRTCSGARRHSHQTRRPSWPRDICSGYSRRAAGGPEQERHVAVRGRAEASVNPRS